MNYPVWGTDFGHGLLMGSVAVVHVFISHFAIGGGLYLVVAETWARRRGDDHLLAFLRRLSKFFVLLTLVMGALTGVSIWFIIGLLNPAATEVLIHNFVWAWATEWTFFVVEILAAILYYYGWKRMPAREHLLLGWIYFISAWLSLFVINGIVTFMLTPGDWLETGEFWDAFFNPTFWPSLALRTGICVMLAGLYGLLVAARLAPDAGKVRIVRVNAVWGLVGLGIAVACIKWYRAAIPEAILVRSEHMYWPKTAFAQSFEYALWLAVLLVLFGLLIPRRHTLLSAIPVMLLGLAWFGSFEWFRESIRKPYVIGDYMYANSVEVALSDDYRSQGYLAHMQFQTGEPGKDLFRRACRSCHTLGGAYRDLKPGFDGTDPEFIAGVVRGVHKLPSQMPPFLGTAEEAALLAGYIHSRVDQRHLQEIYDLEGVALGEKVYDVRCGMCHVLGGYKDKWKVLEDLEVEDYLDVFNDFDEYDEAMPAFTGDAVERAALADYLFSLNEASDESP